MLMKAAISTLVLWVLSIAGCRPLYLKLDPDKPGTVPKVFAEKVIGSNGEHVGYCAFSPDGSGFYYAITNKDWSASKMLKVNANHIAIKDTLCLKDCSYEGEPFITADGMTMYFTVVVPPPQNEIWQADIYRCRKTADGWDSPELLDTLINSKASEWHISGTRNNVFYFSSEREEMTSALHGDIYRVDLLNDKFVNRTKLPYPINTKYNDSDPLIAPDESFLVFHSDRPGGFGDHDLYICFNENGKWSNPKNMGSTINTSGWEMAPSLTPDGKYLLFTRRKAMVTTEPAQIWWVSINVLDSYR